MIHVVEYAAATPPRAWFAFDADDLLSKVADSDRLQPWEIHDCATPRELLDLFELTSQDPASARDYPGICAMAAEFGWDRPLYRADYLFEPGSYQPEPVGRLAACEAALRVRGDCLLLPTESDATAAFERIDHPAWLAGGWRARWALREQLVALEVLADDL